MQRHDHVGIAVHGLHWLVVRAMQLDPGRRFRRRQQVGKALENLGNTKLLPSRRALTQWMNCRNSLFNLKPSVPEMHAAPGDA